ncbi:hypothetical protein ACTXT7_013049, partial [Hymenolepis weldensis]
MVAKFNFLTEEAPLRCLSTQDRQPTYTCRKGSSQVTQADAISKASKCGYMGSVSNIEKSSKSNSDKKGTEKTNGRAPTLSHSQSNTMAKNGIDIAFRLDAENFQFFPIFVYRRAKCLLIYDSSSSDCRAAAASARATLPAPGIYRNSNSSASTGTAVTTRPLQLTRPISSAASSSTSNSIKTSTHTTYFGRWGTNGGEEHQESLPSPEEYLGIPPGITLGSIGIPTTQPPEVSEIIITPTTVSPPRPPIPPKNFSHVPPGILASPER